jgi:hypothetical protein
MKRLGLLIAFFAFLAFVMPTFTATGEKKEGEKDKDEKKEPEKKEPEKKPPVEKFTYGEKVISKILSISPDSSRDITIERKEIDQKKVYENNLWSAQRMAQLAQQQAQAASQKDFKARAQQLANYQRDLANYQIELAKRQQNIYIGKPWDLRGAENAKARSMSLPVEFDDAGFIKKWTKKEIEERKDKTGLPGFSVDFAALKSGQYVEVYFPKAVPAKAGPKKKGPDDDDPPIAKDRREYILVVILQEGGK